MDVVHRSLSVKEVFNQSDCWVTVPAAAANELISDDAVRFPVVLRLWDVQSRSPIGFVCWSGETSQSGCLEISHHLCSILEMTEGQQITLEAKIDVPNAERAALRCVSPDDYRLMNVERDFFEEHILRQGAILTLHQILPVWLKQQKLPIHLMPIEMTPPVTFARMTNNTEIEVHPPIDVHSMKQTENRGRGHQKRNVKMPRTVFRTEITEEGASSENEEEKLDSTARSSSKSNSSTGTRHRNKEGSNRRSKPPGEKRSAEKQSVRVQERKHCALRLQRPDEGRLKLTVPVPLNTDAESKLAFLKPDPESKSTSFSTWFPSNVSISTALSTVMFVTPSTATAARLKVGDYVMISRKKIKDQPPFDECAVVRLLLSDHVAHQHCILHEVTAAEIGVKYCQKVYVMTTHLTSIDREPMPELILHPVNTVASSTRTEDRTKENGRANKPSLHKPKEKPKSGIAHIRKLLSKDLKLGVFKPAAVVGDGCQESRGSPLQDLARMTMAYFSLWMPHVSSDAEMHRPSEAAPRRKEMVDASLDLLLRTLIRCWVEVQLNASWKIHEAVQTKANTNERKMFQDHTHGNHHNRFCLPQRCLMHLEFAAKADESTAPVSMPLMMTFNVETEDDPSKEGCVMNAVCLRVALRQGKIKISVSDVEALTLDAPDLVSNGFLLHRLPPWMREQAAVCVDYLKPALGTTLINRSSSSISAVVGMIVSGSNQSGKTSFVSGICQRLAFDRDIMAHVCYVPCRLLWAGMTESVGKFTKEKERLYRDMATAVASAPSVVVFDDVDAWCSVHEEQESVNLSSKRAVEMIKDIIEQIRSKGEISVVDCVTAFLLGAPVVFLATVCEMKKLDEVLCDPGFFDYHLRMCDLTTDIRGEMLLSLFKQNHTTLDSDVLSDMSTWDAGFEFADLERLASRVMHEHINRRRKEGASIDTETFQSALMNFQPAASWKINKNQSLDPRIAGLEDVGGMDDVKAVLHDSIELPIKHPKLVQQCPLRLMSNVLLYGPPGSGKTFIVGALKASLDVRLVSVKGPELLNKYVGQSEAAVRSTFKSAAEAAPCILFFDEFEALGRHRGSDTSGISDRVVNQLLTEMDGVEGLCGVCIIAATSRPDLIDKALLRPGRLDRHVYCPLPSRSDRLKILQILARQQKIDEAIDLEWIADDTEGYSGADLTSIVSEAHLHAVGQHLKSEASRQSTPAFIITQTDISHALERSRPSSSDKEKRFLSEIYSNFSSGRVCNSRNNPGFNGLTYA